MQIAREDTLSVDVTCGDCDCGDCPGNIKLSHYHAISLNIECSILLDYIKKAAFYVKPVKIDAVVKSLKKINDHTFMLAKCFGVVYQDTIDHNIIKLGERYKGHSYSNEQAIARKDKS